LLLEARGKGIDLSETLAVCGDLLLKDRSIKLGVCELIVFDAMSSLRACKSVCYSVRSSLKPRRTRGGS
jgi:hypothetical protein